MHSCSPYTDANHHYFLWAVSYSGSCQLIFPLPYPACFMPDHSRVRSKLSEPTATFTMNFKPFLSPISTSISFLPFFYINCLLEKRYFLVPDFSLVLCIQQMLSKHLLNEKAFKLCTCNMCIEYVHQNITPSNINTQSDYLWMGRLWGISVFYSLFAHLHFLTVQQ